ncbi:MAG: hypothetical protein R2867_27710 [Caldilineaceae bacterium]
MLTNSPSATESWARWVIRWVSSSLSGLQRPIGEGIGALCVRLRILAAVAVVGVDPIISLALERIGWQCYLGADSESRSNPAQSTVTPLT